MLYTSVYVLEDGELVDSPRLRDTLVPLAAPGVLRWAVEGEDESAMPEAYRAPVERYRDLHGTIPRASRHLDIYRGYLWRTPPDLAALVTEDVLRASALIGSADEVIAQIREWESLGVTQLGLRAAGGIDNVAEFAERFGQQVIARY